MHHQVADRFVVPSGDTRFTEAVPMEGANAVYFDAVIFNLGGLANVTARLQQSDDLENWYESADTADKTFSNVGYGAERVTLINSAYVRLRFTGGSSGSNAILSAGINTAKL